MVTKTKPISKELLEKYVYYDPTSDSGLRWKEGVEVNGERVAHSVVGHKSNNRYFVMELFGCGYMVHRVIAVLNGLDVEGRFVDHIDGNYCNNNIENLRVVDHNINCRNQKKRVNNSTGHTGVSIRTNYRDGRAYRYAIAQWRCPEQHQQKTKAFSILKYGIDKAIELASEFRSQKIKELNNQGAGYSERHGIK